MPISEQMKQGINDQYDQISKQKFKLEFFRDNQSPSIELKGTTFKSRYLKLEQSDSKNKYLSKSMKFIMALCFVEIKRFMTVTQSNEFIKLEVDLICENTQI